MLGGGARTIGDPSGLPIVIFATLLRPSGASESGLSGTCYGFTGGGSRAGITRRWRHVMGIDRRVVIARITGLVRE